ncbi:MAG: hypothetical protein AAF363_03265 [Bacteroidota bacterium]
MRSWLIVGLIFINLSISFGQEIENEELYNHYKTVFSRATKYNDAAVARDAVINMMVLNPTSFGLADTLASLYFDAQQYPSTILVSNDILASNPGYAPILELRALSYEQLGLKARALPDYESLYLKNNNVYTLYKISTIQGDLGRNNEALTNLDIIIANEKSMEEKLVFGTSDKKQQEIPIKAAAYNIKGLIYQALDNMEEAKNSYNKALEVSPEFELVKNNLAELEK